MSLNRPERPPEEILAELLRTAQLVDRNDAAFRNEVRSYVVGDHEALTPQQIETILVNLSDVQILTRLIYEY